MWILGPAPERRISFRRVLVLAALCSTGLPSVLGTSGCTPAAPAENQADEAPPPLARHELVDYLPSSGVSWIVQLRPRTLVSDDRLVSEWNQVFQAERVDDFVRASGFDPAHIGEAWIAGYPLGTLLVFDAKEVGRKFEQAFRDRSRTLRDIPTSSPELVHLQAVVENEPRALVHLRGHMIAVAYRDITLAKIVSADAMGKLEKVPAALDTRFLAPFRGYHTSAPLRVFLSGPFEAASHGVASGFVSGVAAVAPREGELWVHSTALGVWPTDALAGIDKWLQQVLGTREMRALGLGFPTERPHATCHASDVVEGTILTSCEASGRWKSAEVASSIYRVTAAPLPQMIAPFDQVPTDLSANQDAAPMDRAGAPQHPSSPPKDTGSDDLGSASPSRNSKSN